MKKIIILLMANIGFVSNAAITLVNESETDTLIYSLKVPGSDWGGWDSIGPGLEAKLSPQVPKITFKYFDGEKTVEVTLTDGEKYLLQGTQLFHRVRPAAPTVVATPGYIVAPQYYSAPVPQYYYSNQPQYYYPSGRRGIWRR